MPKEPSRRGSGSQQALGTSNARALEPSEVGALRAESERLLRLEQELSERECDVREREVKWALEIKDLRAQLDVAQMGGDQAGRERRQVVADLEARATQLQEMLEAMGKRSAQAEAQRDAVTRERDSLSDALARAMQAQTEPPPLLVVPTVHHHHTDEAARVVGAALSAELRAAESLQFESELWRLEEARAAAAARVRVGTLVAELPELEGALARSEADAAELARLLRAQLQAAADQAAASSAQLAARDAEARVLRSLVAAACAEGDAAAAAASGVAQAQVRERRASEGAATALEARVVAAEAEAAEARARLEEAVREAAKAAAKAAAEKAAAVERAARGEVERASAAAQLREGLLREAMGRERNLREAVGRLKAQLHEQSERLELAVADDAELEASQHELELAESRVRRLEKQLGAAHEQQQRQDSRVVALTRRLEALAHAGTESHQSDCSYWVERGKRLDFVGSRQLRPTIDRAYKPGARAVGGGAVATTTRPAMLPPLDATAEAEAPPEKPAGAAAEKARGKPAARRTAGQRARPAAATPATAP